MKKKGMSLIEILVVLAIVAILTRISYSSYQDYVKRSRRSEGIQTLLAIQLQQEKYRITNATYGTLAQVWSSGSTTTNGYYTLAVSGNSATGYTLTATAQGSQATDTANGVLCTPLTLVMNNTVVTKTPAGCWQ